MLTFKGIPVRIHWTFGLILVWMGWVAYQESLTLSEFAWFALIVILLFSCVVLHEFGHALMARHFNIPARDIYLLPIGGMLRLEYLPDIPRKEIWIAIAGPLVNLFLALLSIGLFKLGYPQEAWWEIHQLSDLLDNRGLVKAMIFLNGTLFLFNLIPAYPMDGGRIVRAGLSMLWGRRRATVIATFIAQYLSLGMIVVGIFYEGLLLILIGVFIFLSVRRERQGFLKEVDEEE